MVPALSHPGVEQSAVGSGCAAPSRADMEKYPQGILGERTTVSLLVTDYTCTFPVKRPTTQAPTKAAWGAKNRKVQVPEIV